MAEDGWSYFLDFGDERFELKPEQLIAGRSRNCDVSVKDPSVSRRHAHLTPRGGKILVQDLGSSNGTFVNGERVEGTAELAGGDVLALGDAELQVRVEAPSELATIRMEDLDLPPDQMGEATSVLMSESMRLAQSTLDPEPKPPEAPARPAVEPPPQPSPPQPSPPQTPPPGAHMAPPSPQGPPPAQPPKSEPPESPSPSPLRTMQIPSDDVAGESAPAEADAGAPDVSAGVESSPLTTLEIPDADAGAPSPLQTMRMPNLPPPAPAESTPSVESESPSFEPTFGSESPSFEPESFEPPPAFEPSVEEPSAEEPNAAAERVPVAPPERRRTGSGAPPLDVPFPEGGISDIRDADFGGDDLFAVPGMGEDGDMLPSLDGFDTTLGPGVEMPESMKRARESLAQQQEAAPPVASPALYQQPDPTPPLAGFGVRALAVIVDGLWMLALPIVAGYLGGQLAGAVAAAVPLLVVLFGWSVWGTTPGKRLLGLYVYAGGKKPGIGFGRTLIRLVGYLLSGAILGIGFLMAASKSKQALHDRIAGTYVRRR